MKITAVDAIPLILPLQRPLKMAVAIVHHRESILVCVRTDEGLIGYGEATAAPYFTGESSVSAKRAIDQYMTPVLLGRSPFDINLIDHLMNRVVEGNHAAKAAVNIAMYDLMGKALNLPVYMLLGGKVRDSVATTWHASASEPSEIADEAAAGIEAGFQAVKVKVGAFSHEKDMARLRAVREVVPGAVPLRPDANQGWSPGEAIRFIKEAEHLGLQFVEQPVKRWDHFGMAAVTRAVDTPVLADESVSTAEDLSFCLRIGSVDGAVIKLIKTGGISGALRMAAVAEAANAPVHLAGMPGETSISGAAEVHVACALTNLAYDTGIATHFTDRDIVEQPLLPVNGVFTPPEGPGLGVEVSMELVNIVRQDR